MILHIGIKKHQIWVLLDTGCSIALLNQQTVEKLGIRKKAHRRPHSIENYTGESVKGAGQFYTEPMLLQHRKHYSQGEIRNLTNGTRNRHLPPFRLDNSTPPSGSLDK